MDRDHKLLIQAEMLNLIDGLTPYLAARHPIEFLMHLDNIRHRALQHHLPVVRDLSCALEANLQPMIEQGGCTTIIHYYVEAMRDALDCQSIDASMAEALLANVALRLGGQP